MTKLILLAALALTGGSFASAQSNGVPSAADYPAFSRFVADRNIFDPNRQPHYTSTRTHIRTTTHTHVSASAPAFSLVGTMSYQKGLFAFFSGNEDELKKILPVSQTIAGYTVTQILPGRVTLATTNSADKLELKVGDVVRHESGKWALSDSGELPTSMNTVPATSSASSAPDHDSSASTPSPTLGQNDVLKRLMELRAKENQ